MSGLKSRPSARGFWTQDGNGNDFCVAITHTGADAGVVWDALRRARSIVMEREHHDDRFKGRVVRGWSEDDGYFYAESPDEDPGSNHHENPERAAAIAACPTPVYHETHRYCPSCPWTEDLP